MGAPKERPLNDCPVFKCRTAGNAGAGVVLAWVANPREKRETRMKLRESMLAGEDLMTEEREHEVAEITAAVVSGRAGK